MATTTPILLLRKPAGTDLVDVTLDISNNMTKIDNAFVTVAPSQQPISGGGTAGIAIVAAKADHVHPGAGFGAPVGVGTTNSEGSATTAARSDHIHAGGIKFVALDTWLAMEANNSETVKFYMPGSPLVLRLSLFGNMGRPSGPLASHSHTNTAVSSNTGDPTADHSHSLSGSVGNQVGSTGLQSGDHTHGVNSGGAHSHTSPSHTHTIGSHGHNLDVGGATSPPWKVTTTSGSGTTVGNLIQGTGLTTDGTGAGIDSGGDHSHTTGGISANHTHDQTHGHSWSGSSGGVSANHQHDFSHNHTMTSVGTGGYTNYRWPQGVTVIINGSDRTTALGGAFGPSQADWESKDLNIAPYITTAGWHSIQLNSTTAGSGGRLRAHVWAEV